MRFVQQKFRNIFTYFFMRKRTNAEYLSPRPTEQWNTICSKCITEEIITYIYFFACFVYVCFLGFDHYDNTSNKQ